MNPSAASFMKLVGVVLRVRFGVPIWRNLIVIALTGVGLLIVGLVQGG